MTDRDAEIEAWLAVLPYPLAAVLWRFVGEGDIRARLDDSMYFFEATARYLSILALSGLERDSGLFAASRPSWQGSGRLPSDTMARTTLGTWVRFHHDLAAPIRRLLHDQSTTLLDAFCISDPDALSAITSKRIVRILDEATAHRNEWRGHDAGATPAERGRRVHAMVELVLSLRDALGGHLDRWDLIKPISMRHRDGHLVAEAFVFDGPNPRIRISELPLEEAVRTDSLYVVMKGQKRALPLLPLLSAIQSDEVAESSVYFYDRMDRASTRWLSYDAMDRPERETPTPDWLPNLLRKLDAPPVAGPDQPDAATVRRPDPAPRGADGENGVEPRAKRASRPATPTISSELIAAISAIDPSIRTMELDGEVDFFGHQCFARLDLTARHPGLLVHVPIERVPHVQGLLMVEVPVTRDDRPGLSATIDEWSDIPKAVALAGCAFAIDQGFDLPLTDSQGLSSGAGVPATYGNGLWPDATLSASQLRGTWERLDEAISTAAIPLTPAKNRGGPEFRTTSASGFEINIRVDASWSYVACIVLESVAKSAIDRLVSRIPSEPLFSATVCIRAIDSASLLRPLVPSHELIELPANRICEAMIEMIAAAESNIRNRE